MEQPSSKIDARIGQRLKMIREDRRMSQEALGAEIGVTRGQIWHHEHGLVPIKPPRLEQLAYALHCRVADILSPLNARMPRYIFRGGPPGASPPLMELSALLLEAAGGE